MVVKVASMAEEYMAICFCVHFYLLIACHSEDTNAIFPSPYTGDQDISQPLCALLMAQNVNVCAMCDSHCTSVFFPRMCVNFVSILY